MQIAQQGNLVQSAIDSLLLNLLHTLMLLFLTVDEPDSSKRADQHN